MGALRDEMERRMHLRGFAEKTCAAYLRWVRELVRFSGVIAGDLKQEHVDRFLAHLSGVKHLSASSVNQACCALRFFFREVLKRPAEGMMAIRSQRAPVRVPVTLMWGAARDWSTFAGPEWAKPRCGSGGEEWAIVRRRQG
jgi:site-specific recombinase XerD